MLLLKLLPKVSAAFHPWCAVLVLSKVLSKLLALSSWQRSVVTASTSTSLNYLHAWVTKRPALLILEFLVSKEVSMADFSELYRQLALTLFTSVTSQPLTGPLPLPLITNTLLKKMKRTTEPKTMQVWLVLQKWSPYTRMRRALKLLLLF